MISIDSREELKGTVHIYGNQDKALSPYLKCWIAQPDEQQNVTSCVVGLIGPGTARSLQANWTSPFEQSNIGGLFERVGGLAQATSGLTSVTTFSSTQVWEGNRPHNFTLVLSFYALRDAWEEVMAPLRELEKMMGPNIAASDGTEMSVWAAAMTGSAEKFKEAVVAAVKNVTPAGRIPRPVMINIGRRMLVKDCVIESMSVPLDKERTKEGWLVRAEATLNVSTKRMLNEQGIADSWPGPAKK